MTTDKDLIEVANKYVEETYPMYQSKFLLDPIFVAGAEFQKTRWNEGVNVPDDEHEDGQHRDILILDKRSKVVFIGWYDAHLDCYFQCDENAAIKPETIMWQEIYLPE